MENNRLIKWILINDEIRLSTCLYHRDLLYKNEKQNFVKGGGIIIVDKENKLIKFTGESIDFGKVNKNEFESVLGHNTKDILRSLWFCLAMIERNEDICLDDYKIVFE